jgi:holliday junction DNA helicase RuvB
LAVICKRTASVYGNAIDDDAIKSLSMRSRGTPRIVNRLFRRVRDFADIMNDGYVTGDITNRALLKLGIDPLGLDQTDYRYLEALITRYKGGPAGLEAIAASISEEVTTVEDVYEPFLLQEGFISRTPRGRIATKKAYQTLNIPYYEGFLDT